MRRFAVLTALLLLAACDGEEKQAANPDPNHTHADFAVYVLGTQLDFSDDRYMSGLSTDEHTHDEEGEYLNKYLHLHDRNGHVLHSHRPGLTLGEFFTSLGVEISSGSVTLNQHLFDQIPVQERETHDFTSTLSDNGKFHWQMFVNGEEVPLDPMYAFDDLDRILITYDASDTDLDSFDEHVTDDACLYSQTCPERGKPPAENCISDPEVPCVAPLEDASDW